MLYPSVVLLDDGRDLPRPDHSSVTTEIDDFAIGHGERHDLGSNIGLPDFSSLELVAPIAGSIAVASLPRDKIEQRRRRIRLHRPGG